MSEPPALSGLRVQKKAEADMKAHAVSGFQHTFLRDQTSRNTLITMMRWSGFFATTGDKEQQIQQNFMKRVLCQCGIWPLSTEDGVEVGNKSADFINKLSELI